MQQNKFKDVFKNKELQFSSVDHRISAQQVKMEQSTRIEKWFSRTSAPRCAFQATKCASQKEETKFQSVNRKMKDQYRQ